MIISVTICSRSVHHTRSVYGSLALQWFTAALKPNQHWYFMHQSPETNTENVCPGGVMCLLLNINQVFFSPVAWEPVSGAKPKSTIVFFSFLKISEPDSSINNTIGGCDLILPLLTCQCHSFPLVVLLAIVNYQLSTVFHLHYPFLLYPCIHIYLLNTPWHPCPHTCLFTLASITSMCFSL